LVLKEGQIVESGSFRELTAQNGVFAAMWADQISAEEDVPEVLKEVITGYVVAPEIKEEVTDGQPEAQDTAAAEVVSPESQNPFADPFPTDSKILDVVEGVVTASPQAGAAELPSEAANPEVPELDAQGATQEEVERSKSYVEVASGHTSTATGEPSGPITFPSSEPTLEAEAKPEPIAFPSQQVIGTSPEIPVSPVSPGVTFSSAVAAPSSRAGTPDPEGKPKRIRKTSQNIQKFARTLSFVARRQSTASVTATKADTNTPRTSREDSSMARGEGSVAGDSATDQSIVVGDDKEAKGKGKKIKRMKATK
jgi:ATP-binding cassette subfamily B (MDR/TAP) protein 6